MLEAAKTLFIRDGYAATTMTAIAEQADVAVQTVYAVFGTKRAILNQLLDVRIVRDDQSTTLRDRVDWQAMEREPDPAGNSLCWPPSPCASATASAPATR